MDARILKLKATVLRKDSANLSVFVSMLYPKEHLLVKVNGHVVFAQIDKDSTGSPTGEYYFRYPDSIKRIEITSQYNGKVLLTRLFKDTLTVVAQRTIFISRPFPKGITKENTDLMDMCLSTLLTGMLPS